MRSDWPKPVMLTAGCAVAVLGTAVLAAWYVHFIPLIQALPGHTPTHRMTALGLLLSGSGLAFAAANRRWPAVLCAAIVFTGAALVLAEYALGVNMGIDELPGRDYLNVLTSHRGRMSPVSALCFLGASISLILTASRLPIPPASTIVGVLGSLLTAVGAVTALGHLLGYAETFGWTQLTRMSPLTSAGVAALGAGLMAWAWHEESEGQATPRWLPLGLGLGLAMGALGAWQALMAHQQSELLLISHTILAGGVVGAMLVAIAVALAQRARKHSRELQASNRMLQQHITERKRAEAEVRLGNEIFANMEEAVCLIRVEDGIIVHANPKFEKMFGYGPDELTGKRVTDINADTDRPAGEVAEEIRSEIRRFGVWRGEILHRRKDRTLFWCAVTGSIFHHPEFGEVGISIHQDITELKTAQEALRDSEERFRNIFEQGPIGVALLGTDHRMSKANPAFCRMLGYSEVELSRITLLDITHPDDRASSGSVLQRLDRGDIPVCKMEKRYVKKSGEIIWTSLTASVIRDHEGRALCGLGMVEDITERKKAEKKLAEQAALLDLAQDSISVRNLEGRIIFWNRGAKDTYGWSAEEALGRKPQELLQSRYPIPLEKIEAIVLTRGAWEGEIDQMTRDGKPIVVASRWSLWRDERGAPRAILVINRDITQRKRTEEQLRSVTERLSLATRSASIGIWDWDLRTNTSVWDDTHFEIFGIPKVVPLPYEEFVRRVHPEDWSKVQASLQRAIHGKTQDFVEFRILRPDGSVRHLSSAEGVVLDEHDNVVRVVGTAMDITERKGMEAQIEANKEQLVTSARLSALGMMAGNIAHEINNPVGIIHALASNLIDMVEQEEAAPPEVVARSGWRIRETAERISGIVKSLLQISREGSSERFRTTRISKILNESVELCRERFRSNGVELILPRRAPELSVACREPQIAQVLLNLLQNALDAVMEQMGERWVRVEVTAREASVVISVTDSGPGIPPELRSRIMEPFFTTKPVGKGTGLGLSLSKTIAEEHGGRLEFGEDHGRTRFSLALPLVREAEVAWS